MIQQFRTLSGASTFLAVLMAALFLSSPGTTAPSGGSSELVKSAESAKSARTAKVPKSTAKTNEKASGPTTGKSSTSQLETYRDLIQKAQNLTLQRDRLQTSQVLSRALGREAKGSTAFKELVRALDELTGVFYTDKAQNLFAVAETNSENKPREAIDNYLEALRIEDGNVTVLKALARAYLRAGDCDRADSTVKSAESVNGFSVEVKLLRLQVIDCQKKPELLTSQLSSTVADLEAAEPFSKGLQMKDLLRRKDLKKAKSALAQWENQNPENPELYYWKWQYGKQAGAEDRSAALRYSQLCQNMSARKRKSYNLDVDLCKGKEAVDAYLKDSGFLPSAPTGGNPNELKAQ
jgi:tetratricopeptide (TPR) repeat protein